MKHIIDPDQFERKDSLAFFQSFIDPNLSITSEVECTGAKERSRKHGIPFFLYYTHAMIKAANEIKEFKYRMDLEGRIIYYDNIHVLSIIRTSEKGSYNTIFFEYDDDLISFAKKAQDAIENHTVSEYPFENDSDQTQTNESNVFLISALPTLSFTGISFAHQNGMESYPLSLVGKVITRENKEYIPIAIKVNHAFMDGYHIDKFYARLRELLQV